MMHSPLVQRLLRNRLAALLALVAAARLIVALAAPGGLAWGESGPTRGVTAYDAAAQQLLVTGQFAGGAGLSPVYSMALAGVYGWFGRSALTVALWHTALAVLTAYALYELGRRLFRGWGAGRAEAVGWLAGLLVALSPVLLVETISQTETPL
ncbi:MAG: hypothetical protein ACRC1H_13985, partial [Caldilineaceae bacterium]